MNRQIERLSYSGMTTWHQCGYKFWLHYIEGLPGDPPSEATLVGTVVHEALESIFAPEATVQASLPEAAKRAWGNNQEAIDALGDVDIQSMKRNVLSSLSLLYSSWRDEDIIGTEVKVEREWTTPKRRTAKFHGYVDAVVRNPNGTLLVVDYKTGKGPDMSTPWGEPQRDERMIQPALYAAALGSMDMPVTWYVLDYAPGNGQASYHASEVGSEHYEWAVGVYLRAWDEIAEAVESGITPAPTTSPLCGWCDFLGTCEAGQEAVRQRWALNKPVGPGKEVLGLC